MLAEALFSWIEIVQNVWFSTDCAQMGNMGTQTEFLCVRFPDWNRMRSWPIQSNCKFLVLVCCFCCVVWMYACVCVLCVVSVVFLASLTIERSVSVLRALYRCDWTHDYYITRTMCRCSPPTNTSSLLSPPISVYVRNTKCMADFALVR